MTSHWSAETVAEARRLKTDGLKYTSISARLGVPYDTLLGWLSRGERLPLTATENKTATIKALQLDGKGVISEIVNTHGQELVEALVSDLKACESWRCASVLMKALREYTKNHLTSGVSND